MKVVIYTHDWLPLIGGIQTVYLNLCKGLAEWPQSHPGETIETLLVTQTPAAGMDDSQFPFQVVRQPGLAKLFGLIRSADVVHIAGAALLPLVMGLALKKPLVLEHHGFQTGCPNGQLFFEPTQEPCPGHFMARRYRKCLECNARTVGLPRSFAWLCLAPLRRWFANLAAVNIAPTDWLGKLLGLRHTRVVHHGVSVAPVSAGAVSDSSFAYQGRLVTSKGVRVLLRAAQQLHRENCEFHLKIIGDGFERESLLAEAAKLNGRVEFLGRLPDEALVDALSGVAAVVVPSLGGEVFGMVAAENMQRGRLLIYSDLGSLREVVGDAGLAFPPGDSEALSGRMREVLGDPHAAAKLSARGRARAQEMFSLQGMVESHVAIYSEVLSAWRDAARAVQAG